MLSLIMQVLLILSLGCLTANASTNIMPTSQMQVMKRVNKAKRYITKHGIEKGIDHFKNAEDIFIANNQGLFFVSPLHPELIGKIQFNYKDPTGKLVVQEEINKAKSGGGWLQGRWRYNALTKTYQCRKIYIIPIEGHYLMGSWYHYTPREKGICLI